jgi:nicotinamide-nucleotide amidase
LSSRKKAGVVVIGSELLLDGRQDTNGPWIADQLSRIGIEPSCRIVVVDDPGRIESALHEAMRTSDLVVVSGGLGPTFDDVTRESVAAALKRKLVRDLSVEKGLRERYERRKMRMPDVVARMADRIEGAELLTNSVGTAPGQYLAGPPALALLPGVPSEMEAMLLGEVIPRVQSLAGREPGLRRNFRIAGMYESEVEAKLRDSMSRWSGISATILAAPGDVCLILRAEQSQVQSLDSAAADVTRLIGKAIVSEGDRRLEEVVGELLSDASLTLALAESCTGGMLGSLLTSVPGSSSYFLGGQVVYQDRLKSSWLGVAGKVLADHGAVSVEASLAMARGIREQAGAGIGLSITGVAGPGGGTPLKPLGRVYLGLAGSLGEEVKELNLPGDRQVVRTLACRAALNLLRLRLMRRQDAHQHSQVS